MQVLEALAKDAEDCEAEVRSFCMLVNDATNVTGNVANLELTGAANLGKVINTVVTEVGDPSYTSGVHI